MKDFKSIILTSFKLLLSKGILSTTVISLVLSFFLVGIMILSFWNLFPSITWPRLILGEWYDSIISSVWSFLISSIFFFLYPPTCTLLSGLFLDRIVEKTYLHINKKVGTTFFSSNYLSGILAGLKILLYSSIIFILILILKIFFISSTFLVLIIQFLATSYVVGREYYDVVAVKIFPRDKFKTFKRANFLYIFILGIIGNLIFLIPLLNLIAPIKITVMMTLKADLLNKKFLD